MPSTTTQVSAPFGYISSTDGAKTSSTPSRSRSAHQGQMSVVQSSHCGHQTDPPATGMLATAQKAHLFGIGDNLHSAQTALLLQNNRNQSIIVPNDSHSPASTLNPEGARKAL